MSGTAGAPQPPLSFDLQNEVQLIERPAQHNPALLGVCRRRCNSSSTVCRRCIAGVVLTVAVLLALALYICFVPGSLGFLRPAHPEPIGSYMLGSIRARMPDVNLMGPGLFAQIYYPSHAEAAMLDTDRFEWFRPEVYSRVGRMVSVFVGRASQLDPSRAPLVPQDGKRWPIVIFSGGLFSTAEMYTQFCRDMASLGMVVIAIEHEDGSGFFAVNGTSGKAIEYKSPPKGVNLVDARRHFLEQQHDEIQRTASGIIRIVQDKSSSLSDVAPEVVDVLRLADSRAMLLAGHSFGAAGIFNYLREVSKSSAGNPFKGALLVDLWAAPIEAHDRSGHSSPYELSVPFALMFSDHWAQMRGVDARIFREVASANVHRCIAAVLFRGTKHQWISEASYFAPAIVMRKVGIMGSGDRDEAYRVTALATKFILEALLNSSQVPHLNNSLESIGSEVLAGF